jgi:hypothetical protein
VLRDHQASDNDPAGRRIIEESEAAAIRRIYSGYAGGLCPGESTCSQGRPCSGPARRPMDRSLLLGNASREIGILRNRLYAAELVWNRQHFVKNPTTGKRVARGSSSLSPIAYC